MARATIGRLLTLSCKREPGWNATRLALFSQTRNGSLTLAETSTLSDGACAIFAFAAYHQLQSGQPVTKVIIDDGAGHKADEAGRKELAAANLASDEGNFIVFNEAGLAALKRVVDGMKSAVNAG